MDYEAIIAAGGMIGDPKTLGDDTIPFAVVPEGSEVHDLEKFLRFPVRTRAAVAAHDVPTFCAYFNRFKREDSAVFAAQEKFLVVGIIDYHGVELPAFREHRVSYAAPRSVEWTTWVGSNGKKMTQGDFALFIEDNLVDIRKPAGADMLEVSRSLQAKKAVEFSSGVKLADGSQQFSYSETVDGSTAKGALKVPDEFTLGIPVFFNDVPYEVKARLRYRIDHGKLVMWYDLFRQEYIEQDAFKRIVDVVLKGTATPVWMGAPG